MGSIPDSSAGRLSQVTATRCLPAIRTSCDCCAGPSQAGRSWAGEAGRRLEREGLGRTGWGSAPQRARGPSKRVARRAAVRKHSWLPPAPSPPPSPPEPEWGHPDALPCPLDPCQNPQVETETHRETETVRDIEAGRDSGTAGHRETENPRPSRAELTPEGREEILHPTHCLWGSNLAGLVSGSVTSGSHLYFLHCPHLEQHLPGISRVPGLQ